MEPKEPIDEVALNVLLAEGTDVPTAMAGSIKDESPPSKAGFGSFLIWLFLGALATMLFVGWLSS